MGENVRPVERLRIFAKWANEQGYVKGEAAFEKHCGLSVRYIANSLSGGKSGDMTTAIISRIYEKFPMLSLVWLCTGKGSMIDYNQETNINYKGAYEGAMQQIVALNRIIASLEVRCDTNVIPLSNENR